MTKKRTSPRKPASSLSPYLTVRGADAAIEFYKAAFGAKEISRIESAVAGLLQHAELKICRTRVFLCDELPVAGVLGPQSLGGSPTLLHLEVSNVDKMWDAALEAGAVEISPLVEAPWGGVWGKLVDPFGHYWSIAGETKKTAKNTPLKASDVELSSEPEAAVTAEKSAEH